MPAPGAPGRLERGGVVPGEVPRSGGTQVLGASGVRELPCSPFILHIWEFRLKPPATCRPRC